MDILEITIRTELKDCIKIHTFEIDRPIINQDDLKTFENVIENMTATVVVTVENYLAGIEAKKPRITIEGLQGEIPK